MDSLQMDAPLTTSIEGLGSVAGEGWAGGGRLEGQGPCLPCVARHPHNLRDGSCAALRELSDRDTEFASPSRTGTRTSLF